MALELIARAKRERWTRLDLGNCGIFGALPEEIAELDGLEELYLSEQWWEVNGARSRYQYTQNQGPNNRIQSLPTQLPDSLRRFYARGQWIVDISILAGCKNLEVLDLANTKVKEVAVLGELVQLRWLNLSSTYVGDLSFITSLSKLEELILNYVSSVDFRLINHATTLKALFLKGTSFDDLDVIKKLKGLQRLGIEETKVSDLSPLISFPQLNDLRFDKDEIRFPPQDILGLGPRAIRDYLIRHIKEEEAKLAPQHNWLLKVVIVGNSGLGKSSLLASWKTGKAQYAPEGTVWLGHETWSFGESSKMDLMRPKSPGSKELTPVSGSPTLHVFDFGGQDYYHDAHHLFFSSDTAYVVIWDNEHEKIGQESDSEGIVQTYFPLNYWLDAIRYHCQAKLPVHLVSLEGSDEENVSSTEIVENGGSEHESDNTPPVIKGVRLPIHALILQSKIDTYPRVYPKMDQLQQVFPWIYDFDSVSVNPESSERLDMSISKFKEMISKIPLLGAPFSPTMMWVRDALSDERDEKVTYSVVEFVDWANHQLNTIANQHQLAPKTIKKLQFSIEESHSLLKYLSSLGLVLHYPQVTAIKDFVYMKPQLVRERVLEVLKGLKGGDGYFSTQEVQDRLMEVSSGLDATQLLALLQEFKMAFEVGGKNSGKWIAPLYLPLKAPAGMEMLLEVFDKPIRRIVYPNFIHKSVTLELFQAFSQDLLPESHQGLASLRHIVWRDGMVIRLKDSPEMVLVKFFIGEASTADREAQEANIEVYAFKTPSGAKPAEKVLQTLRKINLYWDTREEVTVDGRTFVPIETLYEAAKAHETHFSHLGKNYSLETYRSFVSIPWKRIFISYAAQDETYCTELIKHLSPLNRNKRIAIWEKAQLIVGSDRRHVQREEMDRADILILLISADYFSDSHRELIDEYTSALQRAKERSATIGYIVIRNCDYESTELEAYRGLLGEGEVIGDVPRNDTMWKKVVEELKKLLPDWKGGGFV